MLNGGAIIWPRCGHVRFYYDPETVKAALKQLDSLLYETMRDSKVNRNLQAAFVGGIAPLLQISDFYTLVFVDLWYGFNS